MSYAPPPNSRDSLSRRGGASLSTFLLQLVPVLCLIYAWSLSWNLPSLEDDKFWWIPQGMIVAERGLLLTPAGNLPLGLLPDLAAPPPQWRDGVPDYGHPPLMFWYLGLWIRVLGPEMRTIHLSLLPLGLLGLFGMMRLTLELARGRRLAQVSASLVGILWALCPPVVAQLGRADLDLALLAIVPWALEAIIRKRLFRFAMLSCLATGFKEPGVLLSAAVVPAVLWGHGRQRFVSLAAGCAPFLALLGWALLHQWDVGWALASAERLPTTLLGWLNDLGAVTKFSMLEQGRWALLPWIVWGFWQGRGTATQTARWALLLFLIGQLAFFGTVNFLGGDPAHVAGTHWRYLLPALVPFFVLAGSSVACLPAAPGTTQARIGLALGTVSGLIALLLGTADWHGPPRGGVERNLYLQDLARAHQRAAAVAVTELKTSASEHAQESGQSVRLWIGSHAWVELRSPAVGSVQAVAMLSQVHTVQWYAQETQPESIQVGDLFLVSSHGEPLGLLEHRLSWKVLERIDEGSAWVEMRRVMGHRSMRRSP